MPVLNTGGEGQDAYSVAVLPNEGTMDPQCESQLAFLSLIEIPDPLKNQPRLTESKSLNHVNFDVAKADSYFPCIVDIDIEKGKLDTPKTNDKIAANLKNEDPLTRTLQRQISVQIGGKIMQQLMNCCVMLPKLSSRDKCAVERVNDAVNNNRSRKFKRSASFNSRKVVLLFSILSSMGTIILIYLTLRVRQMADVSILA
ncbi:hypothetical protein LguiA_003198 [Lonicera macranthoides]